MASIRLAPDAILEQSNLTGAVAAIADDPDAPDSSWLTAASNNADSIVRVSFSTPPGDLTGTQEFRVLVRRINGQTGTPLCRVELYSAGVLVSTPVADTSVVSVTGVVLAGTFTATGTGADIECRVYGTKSGGSPGARNTIEVGAIEWNASYTVSVPAAVGSVAISGGGLVASTGSSSRIGQVALTSGGSVTAQGISARFGSAAISAGGVVTSLGSQIVARFGSVVISAGGAVAATGRKAAAAAVFVSSGGSVAAQGRKAAFGATLISSGGAVTSMGLAQRFAQVLIQGGGIVTAVGYRVGQAAALLREGTATLMGVGR